MMHYPDKITCDANTYDNCRLPSAHFEVLETKQMKGLKNVGVIREFLEQTKEETMTAKSITHSDYPLLGNFKAVLKKINKNISTSILTTVFIYAVNISQYPIILLIML